MNIQKTFVNNNKNLYIIATPIGNYLEINNRAIECFNESEIILAESQKWLNIFVSETKSSLKNKKIIYIKAKNENIYQIKNFNKNYCLISDCGYPILCDPGYKIVKQFIDNNYNIVVVNGSSPIIHSLIASTFSPFPFYFLGFMPKKENQIKNKLMKILNLECTTLFYISDNNIIKTLKLIKEMNSKISLCVLQDLTKKTEIIIKGNVIEIYGYFLNKKPKGQYVMVI